MSMETHEEATTHSSGSNDNDHSHAIMKGKRSKRQRLLLRSSPIPVAASTSSTSASLETSGSVEEEDMANCLILLSLGHGQLAERGGGTGGEGEKLRTRKLAEVGATTNEKVGIYAYECKTCNKCFPSFQALGGHRSSHKKLKMATAEEKRSMRSEEENSLQISVASYPNSSIHPKNSGSSIATPALHCNNIAINSNKMRMHECSICGSEFPSGQALGGHMRRHRAVVPAAIVPESQQVKKEKSLHLLSLDLNLPAPADDERGELSLGFAPKQPLVFSASALVDCHY